MSIKFVSKVVGGAALGTGLMLFGAPAMVSADGAPEHKGPDEVTNIAVQANVGIVEQEALAVAKGGGDAFAVNLAQIIQVNIGEIDLNIICVETFDGEGGDAVDPGLYVLDALNSNGDMSSLSDTADVFAELAAVEEECGVEAEAADDVKKDDKFKKDDFKKDDFKKEFKKDELKKDDFKKDDFKKDDFKKDDEKKDHEKKFKDLKDLKDELKDGWTAE